MTTIPDVDAQSYDLILSRTVETLLGLGLPHMQDSEDRERYLQTQLIGIFYVGYRAALRSTTEQHIERALAWPFPPSPVGEVS